VVVGLSAHAAQLIEFGPGAAIWIVAGVAIVWCIGVTNAYNFMDGIDGMAALQGVIGGLAWAAIAFMDQREWLGVLSVLVAGGSLGFSYHNWHPARIFMGDVGSAFLGFTFAFIALAMPHTAYQLGSGVLVLWPLLFDTAFTLVQRLRGGQNIFQAHRSHLYQRLVLAGWGQRRVAMLYGTFTATTSVLGIVWWFAESSLVRILIVAVVMGISYGLIRLVTATDVKHSEAGVRVH
jgi:UDP-N-acetylmuramyl pentapeptide phosphotransferase/UDP-N-acetylglucosamine-1-phosphate transferase